MDKASITSGDVHFTVVKANWREWLCGDEREQDRRITDAAKRLGEKAAAARHKALSDAIAKLTSPPASR
jgi:hypothetical protein